MFFDQTQTTDPRRFLELYIVAKQLIERVFEMDTTESDFIRHLPSYYSRVIVLAAFCILKISKSSLRQTLQLYDADSVFYKAVNITMKRSVRPGDLDAYSSIMLTKLWTSTNIFVRPDGTRNSLRLDLRSRLVSLQVI